MLSLVRPVFSRFRVFCLLLFVGASTLPTSAVLGQSTIVRGQVRDGATGEPLAFANVFFKQTQRGGFTDEAGKFRIETSAKVDTVVVSFFGYLPQYLPIQAGAENELDIVLAPENFQIEEVVIVPPAYPIIRKAINRKPQNDRAKFSAYQYEAYTKMELGLGNLTEKVRNKAIYKPFQPVFDHTDSLEGKPYLPVFLTETLSEVFFQKEPRILNEKIIASRVSGVSNESFSMLLGDLSVGVNIYEDHIVLLYDKYFISPISGSGFKFYEYDLLDSLKIGEHWVYQIHFFPKKKQALTFTGDIWIEQGSYAVKRVNMDFSEGVDVNYVRSFRIYQEYEEVEEENWMPVKDHIEVRAEILMPHEARYQEFIGKRTASYKHFVFNQPLEEEAYSRKEPTSITDSALTRGEDFWTLRRHDTLTYHEELAYGMADSVKNLPVYRFFRTLFRGYADLGKVEIGPIFTFYSYNPIEGNRIKFGGRLVDVLGKNTSLSAYGAYGFRDKRYKYGGTFRGLVSEQPRQVFSASYMQDVQQLGGIQNIIRNDNFFASIFSGAAGDKLNDIQKVSVSYEREWFEGFSHEIELSRRALSALGQLDFTHMKPNGEAESEIVTTEVSLQTHFAWKEDFLSDGLDRISLGSDYPVFNARYTLGMKGVLGSDYNYHKLVLGLRHKILLGRFGYINYRVEGGKVWGNLPYALLMLPSGNETVYYVEDAFNMMDFFEFVGDQYVNASVSYHLEGLIFSRLPLLKKLNWREVLAVKGITGQLSDRNLSFNRLPSFMFPLNEPYAEASVGVKNIFGLLRVDGVWRLTHLDHPNAQRFGIRVRMDLDF